MTNYIIPAEVDQQSNQAMTLYERALAVTITDDMGYGVAGQMLSEVKSKAKELDRIEKSLTKPINDGLKKIRDFFRVPKGRLYEAEQALAGNRVRYRGKVDREKREAERMAAEASCNERERLEREAAELEEDSRKERESDEATARHFGEQGHPEMAEAARKWADAKYLLATNRIADLRHIASTWPTAPIVHREPPKTQGVYTVRRWHAVVTDKDKLIMAVANGQVSTVVLTANMDALNKMAIALKEQLNIPGVVAESSESESVRTSS